MLIALLLIGCTARSTEPENMGHRWTEGAQQPDGIMPGWRCDVWRGHRDRPNSVGCHAAAGDAEEVADHATASIYTIDNAFVWTPDGLPLSWACSVWRMSDTHHVSACYPLEAQ